ncbi:MAG TPA: hypothetical protein DDW30_09400 [Clostridiales bacterium]|nr:hypothetical protein [Clostridiales bacterium]
MELIRISDRKLKIMLTAADMTAYDFDPDTISNNTAQTGHAFRMLLADIRRQIAFDTEDRHLTVQYFPSRGGGCEMFVSSIPTCAEGRKKLSAPREGGALTVRAGRQTVPAFRRDGAYRFACLDDLLRACRRLEDASYIGESTAYRDDSGRYYLLLLMVSASPFSVSSEFAFLSEYGEVMNPAHLRLWFREHGSLICPSSAVRTLAALA